MEEELLKPFAFLPGWLTEPFLTIGQTHISAARLIAIGIIVVLAWWLSKQVEHWLQRLADRLADENEPGSGAGAYAFSRVARYLVWVLATVIGLTSLGFDLTSLAILGGAIGVGLGIGLQGFFGNLFAGLVICSSARSRSATSSTCSRASWGGSAKSACATRASPPTTLSTSSCPTGNSRGGA